VPPDERPLTMLFTDVEGSTRLAQALGNDWAGVLADHRQLIRREIEGAGGRVETTEGDSFFATFAEPLAAVRVATTAQRGLRDHAWPEALVGGLRVRMGVHVGVARHTDGHWVGLEVHRAARIADAAHGGQVIVSEPVRELLDDESGCEELGRHRLKDFDAAERLFHLRVDERHARDFPPPRTLGRVHSILGREADLSRLAGLVERVASGRRGATLIVEGPPGIGKTRLMDELRRLAVERGMEVCVARGAELERDFPFGLARQLLSPALADVDELSRAGLLAGAAQLAMGVLGSATGAQLDAGAAMHGLYWLTSSLAARAPLLLSVDDAQWGDDASLRFLAYLARRSESLPVLIALASHPLAEGEAGVLVSELASGPAAEHLSPTSLDDASTARLLGERLGRPADPRFAAACLEATGGNPFLLGELAGELNRQGIEPSASEIGQIARLQPDRVAHSVALRVGRSGKDAKLLAPAIALLDEGAELSLAGELAGLDATAAAEAFDGLVREGMLLGALPPRYVHPLLRTAAEGLLAPAERSRLHGRAAELLSARDAPVEQVASHVVEAPRDGDAGRVEVLSRAARKARDRGAPDVAVRLLRRALDEPPGDSHRAQLLYELGLAERELGLDAAKVDLREAAEADDRLLAARATRALIWAMGPDPDAHRASISLLDRTIEQVAGAEPSLSRELEALRLGSLWLVPDFADRLDHEVAHCRDLAGDGPAESLALTFLARVLMQRGEPATTVETAVTRAAVNVDALANDDMASLWLLNLAIVTMALDRLDLVEPILERALAYAQERGSANRFALASNLRGMLRHAAGDLWAAESDTCVAIASEGLKGPMAYQSYVPLIGSLADQGRVAEGERILGERGLDGAMPEARPLTALLAERGRLKLAAGDDGAGLADLEEASRRLAVSSEGRGAIGLDAWLDRILALAARGREEEARLEAGEALEAARAWGIGRAVGGALRVSGLLAEGEERRIRLEESVEWLAGSNARLWHARALVDLAFSLRDSGRDSEALQRMREGLELAEACGAAPLVVAARRSLAEAGVEDSPREEPMDRLGGLERRVSELAVNGASDAEIAQSLFVTVKAVEDHLSGAQRKLAAGSRRELVELLRRGQSG
jgi:class 3 adenylate cyclase/DNA-binding CsgD family transcriptional regulator